MISYCEAKSYDIIQDDLILIDYMSPSMCEEMIRLAEEHGGWDSLSYDSTPGQEIRLKRLNLWDAMVDHWNEVVIPIIHHHWYPMKMYGMRDAFVLKYSMDTQTSMDIHTDASLVTGSVKLNDDYEGAKLVFPRQKFANDPIPVGKCLLFPGSVTHCHACTELESGVKYSLTMWSKRTPKDSVKE
jgi:hypothetical protein